jgi:hypothetical protein
MKEKKIFTLCKRKMHGGIRHSNFTGKEIKVAVLGGAGSFAIKTRFKRS